MMGILMMDIISQMKEIWPGWTVVGKIGEGAYGQVYKVSRVLADKTYYSAVKVITVPQNEGEIKAVLAEEGSHSATKAHFKELVDDCIREITIMMDLRGTANVVEVEDFQVIESENEIRWDIFIRMEYLNCLTDLIAERKFSVKEAAKLGIDLCSALEICEKKQIIHRDIKPGNIFVSEFGTYKLGDFGIARQLDRASGTLSSRGTYDYMAPEMFRGLRYDASVDLYALGIVLYKLMNRNRAPFLDPEAERITAGDKEAALGKRISGENLPAPCDASVQMSVVILKACRFDPADRFRTPGQMKAQLENVLNDRADLVIHSAENRSSYQYRDDKTEKDSVFSRRTGEIRPGTEKEYAGFTPNSITDGDVYSGTVRTTAYPSEDSDESDLSEWYDIVHKKNMETPLFPEQQSLNRASLKTETPNTYEQGKGLRRKFMVPVICGILLLATALCIVFIFLPKQTPFRPDDFSITADTSVTKKPTKYPDPVVTVTPTPTHTPTPSPTPAPTASPVPTSPPVPTEKPTQAPVKEPSGQTITIVGGIQAPIEDFVFYFSSQRKITEDELNSMTPSGRADTNIDEMSFDDKQIRLNISQIAIDEIYARHGWTVADHDDPSIADLYAREYLFSLEWYRQANNLYLSGGVSEHDAQLTDIEKENIEALYWWQHMYWNE